MSFDETLADRIRAVLYPQLNIVEKRMFGGIGFLVNGNMACGVHKSNLIVRVGPGSYTEALNRPHARQFDMTGKPMKGWVMVGPPGCTSKTDLKSWVNQGIAFAISLPPK